MTPLVRLTPTAPRVSAAAGADLDGLLSASRYVGYTYAYPHKTAYRPFAQPLPLTGLWAEEPPGATFLYVHVPFCEMRCGFCNLFTRARPQADLQEAYVRAVERQAEQVAEVVGPRPVEVFAFGGGTPTQLSVAQLRRLLELPERHFARSIADRPTSVETSPETASAAHLAQLSAFGIERISIGVQSFIPSELKALGRPLGVEQNVSALDRIRATDLAILNLDLIYGIQGQTVKSWLESLQRALTYHPEELFLYPLYVRALTGLGRRDGAWQDLRPAMYEAARAQLLESGYVQRSMRSFVRADLATPATPYRCQADGMIGLGCGARSYTDKLHYSSEWAVGARGVKEILEAWVHRQDYTHAEYGYRLDELERRTRHVLQSILHVEGIERSWYFERFGADVLEHFPLLSELSARDLATVDAGRVALSAQGLAWSDAIGPALYTGAVISQMEAFDLR